VRKFSFGQPCHLFYFFIAISALLGTVLNAMDRPSNHKAELSGALLWKCGTPDPFQSALMARLTG